MIRPSPSQYAHRLVNTAACHGKDGDILSISQEHMSVGGVKVLSKQFSQLNSYGGSSVNSLTDEMVIRYSDSSQHVLTATVGDQRIPPLGDKPVEATNVTYDTSRINIDCDKNQVIGKNIDHGSTSNETDAKNQQNISKGKSASMQRKTFKETFRKSQTKRHPILNKRSVVRIRQKPIITVEYKVKPHLDTSGSTTKSVKVYLSQKQSLDICGGMTPRSNEHHPSAPPSTPAPELMKRFEYIPSLSDNLAKQQVKSKLKVMKKVESDREKIRQSDRMKIELRVAKEREQELKKIQRRTIYNLNAAMTKAENDQFEAFKKNYGLKPKEYPGTNIQLK